MKFFQSTLLLGLVLVAPAGLTIWILYRFITFFDTTFWPASLQRIPGMGLLVALAFLFMVGLIGKTFAGRILKNFTDWVLEQLPVVRGIYKLFNQVSDAFFSNKSTKASFKKVVMVPFGPLETESIGFLVKELDENSVIVYVPTVPNPMSGFMLEVKRKHLRILDMSVEGAFKVILSCGALYPDKVISKK